MKLFAKKPKADAGSVAACAIPADVATRDSPERSGLIATSAYYKAEARDFRPGNELDDWLEAEADVNSRGKKS